MLSTSIKLALRSTLLAACCLIMSGIPNTMDARGRHGGGGGRPAMGRHPGGGGHAGGHATGFNRPGGGGGHVKPDRGPKPKPDHGPKPKPDHGPKPGPKPGPKHGPDHGPGPKPVPDGPHPKSWGRVPPPPPVPWHRPPMPPHWHPGPGIPPLPPILGIAIGTAFDVGLSYLMANSYDVEGYNSGEISVDNANVFGTVWPDGLLYYENDKLYGAQFTYTSKKYDLARYQATYNNITKTYGSPASNKHVSKGMETTWYTSDNSFITLSFGPATSGGKQLYYTTLNLGR